MSILTIHSETGFDPYERYADFTEIAAKLNEIGVLFERWPASQPLPNDADQEAVLATYAEPVARLKKQYGFQSADVISVAPDHPERQALREKFLAEHTHSDFEVRFFVGGRGLFYLHVGDRVYIVLCQAGDLISVPAATPHWFDMGERPQLKAIRLFTTPEGWVADYTGNAISRRFPKLEEYLERLG